MADNLKPVDDNVEIGTTPNAPIAFDDVGGVLVQRVKIQVGADGAASDVHSGNPLPVTGPLTDTQLRAAAVPVSAASLPLPAGAATQATLAAMLTELQAKADLAETQPVSGPLTDAQLRAAAVPVSLPSGAVAVTITNATSGATIAAGALSLTFDIADADGASVGGVAMRNRVLQLNAPPGRTLPAIVYVATATASIFITEMR